MGNVVAHFPDTGDQGLNTVQHLVKCDGQLIDLVLVFFHRYPLLEAALRYLPGGPGDRCNTRQGPAGHKPSDNGGKDK